MDSDSRAERGNEGTFFVWLLPLSHNPDDEDLNTPLEDKYDAVTASSGHRPYKEEALMLINCWGMKAGWLCEQKKDTNKSSCSLNFGNCGSWRSRRDEDSIRSLSTRQTDLEPVAESQIVPEVKWASSVTL